MASDRREPQPWPKRRRVSRKQRHQLAVLRRLRTDAAAAAMAAKGGETGAGRAA